LIIADSQGYLTKVVLWIGKTLFLGTLSEIRTSKSCRKIVVGNIVVKLRMQEGAAHKHVTVGQLMSGQCALYACPSVA
jgi:hypothetical protein